MPWRPIGLLGLYNGLTDGANVVKPTYRPPSTPWKYYFSAVVLFLLENE
jgi:hypothetical protein